MRRRRRARPIPSVRCRAAVVALALTTAACSGGTGVEADDRPDRAPAPTTATSTTSTTNGTTAEISEVRDVVLVGDSVLVLVEDDLRRRLDGRLLVDAVPCRELADPVTRCGDAPATIASGLDALRQAMQSLAEQQVVPEQVVLVLANNATLTEPDLAEAMAAASPAARVWWVNARIEGSGRQDVNNRLLAALAERDHRAEVIDWFAASEGRALLHDDVHPNDDGQAALARLIVRHLRCRCPT